MTTYADPTRCPDCRAVLPHDPRVCRACSLPLTGQTAFALFRTLQEADRLLGVLREQRQPVPVATAAAPASGSLLDGIEPYPSYATRQGGSAPSPRLRAASVPRILLSLGAVCLLVAAVAFLAVAWQWLGVSGRTVVLVALTAVSLGLSVALLRRGLRTAAESLSAVGLGLLAIDVVGCRHAGWLGPIDDNQLALLTGAVVATVALALLVISTARPLVVPALVAPAAVLVATIGAVGPTGRLLPAAVAMVVLLGLGRVGTTLPSMPLRVTSIAVGALIWLYLVAAGVDRVGSPVTAAHYFGDLAFWPLLAATVVAAAVGPATGARRTDLAGYAVAGLVGTYGLVLPVLDNAPTAMELTLLTASAAWTAVLVAAPGRYRTVALLPVLGTLVVPIVASGGLLDDSIRAVLTVGDPFSRPFGVHVATVTTESNPLLLTATFVVVAGAACAAAGLVEPVRRSRWALVVGTALGLGGLAALPLYDVPLAVFVGILLAAAVGCFVAAERLAAARADVIRCVGLLLVTGDALLALPSDRMVAGVLLVACAIAGQLMARTDTTAAAAAFCLPFAFAGLVWSGGQVLGMDEQFRAVPVLLVLGALAIWRPQLELEASSALVGSVTSAASILLADDLSVSLAVHLTLAGVVVTASSILHPSRRLLAWPGGLLLAVATWVRLADLGVHAPEAYTLPSALVLVAVGGWRLSRDDRSATLTVLAPGLALATVPSLIAMLDDPYSPRALALGVGCVVLLLGGAAVRWSAPVVVGAVVGGLLVLRELAPYAAQVPTWMSIGASGVLLLAVGITWESRMNDVRRASHYVAALR
jgi:hypothetical protein